MKKLNLGLIGLGVVGSGVLKFLKERKRFIQERYDVEFVVKKICDRSIRYKKTFGFGKSTLTTNYKDVVNDKNIDVVIELIGGMKPAEDIILTSLRNGKDVVTANKQIIAQKGRELFREAIRCQRDIYFEASVGAGIPIIKSIREGLAGNKFDGLYGIVNGTTNFILTEMTKDNCSFSHALKEAQRRGFAESNPTLDISGKDSAHKLAILVFLAFGKFVKVEDIYTEGIEEISHLDIDYAQSLNQTIKLLAIAKRVNQQLEVRVHPTMISKKHPLASVNDVFNAIFLNTDPMGDVLMYGQGAGQMSAATGIISDLIDLACRSKEDAVARLKSISRETSGLKLRAIDQAEMRYYIRFLVTDKSGVLSTISGVLGKHGISIASVSQKVRNRLSAVPIIMQTHYAKEKMVRLALEKINKMGFVKAKPLAIRMERL